MAIPSYVLDDIQAGKEYLSEMNQDLREDFLRGCACKSENQKILERVLIALDGKVELDEFDESMEANLDILYSIIGGIPTPVGQSVGYWGSKLDGVVLTYNQIITQGTAFNFQSGSDITVPINVTGFERWWFAIPSIEGAYDKYEDTVNVLNKGDIGTDQDLIGAPTLVSGAVNLNFYQNVYPVPQPNPLIIKKV